MSSAHGEYRGITRANRRPECATSIRGIVESFNLFVATLAAIRATLEDLEEQEIQERKFPVGNSCAVLLGDVPSRGSIDFQSVVSSKIDGTIMRHPA